MHDLMYSITDAFALACVALDKGQNGLPHNAIDDNSLFNVFVIDENGVRTLVRKNITAQLSHALVSSANHGAKIQRLTHTYEAEQVESIK